METASVLEAPAPESPPTSRRRVRIATDALDQRILQTTLRLWMARPVHYYQLLGGSPHTIRVHLEQLVKKKLLRTAVVPVKAVDTWGDASTLADRSATVYIITPAGRRIVQDWEPVGYPAGTTLNLPASDRSRHQVDHTLGVVDLAAWYTRYGCQIVTEREVISLEGRGVARAANTERTYPQPGGLHWATQIIGGSDIHPPDLGVVDTAGRKWAIELERATKDVDTYRRVIKAYRDAGLGQVWHVLTPSTYKRLAVGCARNGINLVVQNNVAQSDDAGAPVRIQMWLPGPSLSGVRTSDWYIGKRVPDGRRTRVVNRWPAHIAAVPPGALTAVAKQSDDDLKAVWARGRTVTLEEAGRSDDGWWD